MFLAQLRIRQLLRMRMPIIQSGFLKKKTRLYHFWQRSLFGANLPALRRDTIIKGYEKIFSTYDLYTQDLFDHILYLPIPAIIRLELILIPF